MGGTIHIRVKYDKTVRCRDYGIDEDGLCHIVELYAPNTIDFLDEYLTEEDNLAAYGYKNTNVTSTAAKVYAILLGRAGIIPGEIEIDGQPIQTPS